MKLKAKIGAVALSAALASMAAMPAFAETTSTDFDKQTAPGSASSVITGTIKPTQISITVPTAAAFSLDPFKPATKPDPDNEGSTLADPTAQIIPAKNYTITNRTPYVPVYVGITSVAVDSTALTGGNAVKLVNNPADVTTDDNAKTNGLMFTVKDSENSDIAPTDFESSGAWMMADIAYNNPFFVDQATTLIDENAGKLVAADATGTAQPGGSITMSFYGQAAPHASWVAGDSFTITPKFTVKTTNWKDQLESDPAGMTATPEPAPGP